MDIGLGQLVDVVWTYGAKCIWKNHSCGMVGRERLRVNLVFRLNPCPSTSQGIEINRENLIAGGRELRAAHGPGILAEMLRDEHAKTLNLVIDSIRTPAEVEALQERPDFRLIEIRASREVRWQRLQSRGRSGDPTDWNTFVAQEESELEALDDSGQALIATAEMADIIIFNDGRPKN